MKQAMPNNWGTIHMPAQHATVKLNRAFTAADMAKIQLAENGAAGATTLSC